MLVKALQHACQGFTSCLYWYSETANVEWFCLKSSCSFHHHACETRLRSSCCQLCQTNTLALLIPLCKAARRFIAVSLIGIAHCVLRSSVCLCVQKNERKTSKTHKTSLVKADSKLGRLLNRLKQGS